MHRIRLLAIALSVVVVVLTTLVVVRVSLKSASPSQSFARELLAKMPVPRDATPVDSLAVKLQERAQLPIAHGPVVYASDLYQVPVGENLFRFFDTHAPSGPDSISCDYSAKDSSTESMCQQNLHCSNLHVSICGVSFTYLPVGQHQELAVTSYVDWLPVLHTDFPRTGVVTVTGYGPSSQNLGGAPGPSASRTATSAEVLALSHSLSRLRAVPPTWVCMEATPIFSITVRSTAAGKVTWSANASTCGDEISITRGPTAVSVGALSCPLNAAVRAALPKTASESRQILAKCP